MRSVGLDPTQKPLFLVTETTGRPRPLARLPASARRSRPVAGKSAVPPAVRGGGGFAVLFDFFLELLHGPSRRMSRTIRRTTPRASRIHLSLPPFFLPPLSSSSDALERRAPVSSSAIVAPPAWRAPALGAAHCHSKGLTCPE